MVSSQNKKGVVAAGHHVTAQAAADILEQGGNAFDAVIAALAASCVSEPILSSLGGGGFLMAYDAKADKTELYDFFVQTPRQKPADDIEFYAIEADFGPARQEFHIGTGSTATPGVMAGIFDIHDTLCSKPLDELFAPAIQAARDGVTINEFQAYLLTVVEAILTQNSDVAQYFAPHGSLLKEGEIYKNPELAKSFEILAKEGRSAITSGVIAQAILEQNQKHGGQLTVDDLIHYQVIKRKPLSWQHLNAAFSLNPAPAASGTLLAFGLGVIGKEDEKTDLAPHEMVYVQQATNTARETLSATVEQQMHFDTLTQNLAQVQKHQKAYRGTTHVSVIDADGNAASLTVTNGEGNGRMVKGCGFMMNNMLGEEDINPNGFQKWKPNMRLSTMMAPTLMRQDNGDLVALGSGGSNRIRTAVLQVILHILSGKNLDDAVIAPRIHVEKCNKISFEDCFDDQKRQDLLSAFPEANAWPDANMFFGGVHAVRRTADGTLEGAGDKRRSGVAIVVE